MLEENGQVVGEFVRSEARKNLGKIEQPKWGEAYRSLVAGLLSYEVEKIQNGVEVRVGPRGGYNKWHGFYIELGTSRQPPHPFLRPAVFNNLKKIKQLWVAK